FPDSMQSSRGIRRSPLSQDHWKYKDFRLKFHSYQYCAALYHLLGIILPDYSSSDNKISVVKDNSLTFRDGSLRLIKNKLDLSGICRRDSCPLFFLLVSNLCFCPERPLRLLKGYLVHLSGIQLPGK